MTVLNIVVLMLVGFSGGIAVGAGFVAFIAVLGIVPRLAQITKTSTYIQSYQWAIIIGSVFWTWTGLQEIHFALPTLLTFFHGLFSGIFVGMLAAALTEVLNVLPILAKRVSMTHSIVWLLMAMVLGKVIGSLFHWLIFIPFS